MVHDATDKIKVITPFLWLIRTLCCKYLRKKSNKKDFPFRKAPATDMITTARSFISSRSRSAVRASSSRVKVCSGPGTTTWIPHPDFNVSVLPRTTIRSVLKETLLFIYLFGICFKIIPQPSPTRTWVYWVFHFIKPHFDTIDLTDTVGIVTLILKAWALSCLELWPSDILCYVVKYNFLPGCQVPVCRI